MVKDGVVHQRRGAPRAVAQSRAVSHDRGVGGGGQGHEVGLGAVQSLPLALSLGCSSLFELSQTTALLFDHLLT